MSSLVLELAANGVLLERSFIVSSQDIRAPAVRTKITVSFNDQAAFGCWNPLLCFGAAISAPVFWRKVGRLLRTFSLSLSAKVGCFVKGLTLMGGALTSKFPDSSFMLKSLPWGSSAGIEASTLSVEMLSSSVEKGLLRDITEAVVVVVMAAEHCSGGGGQVEA